MRRAPATVLALFLMSFDEISIKEAIATLDEEFDVTIDDLVYSLKCLEKKTKMNGELMSVILGGDENTAEITYIDSDDDEEILGEAPIGPEPDLDAD